MMRMLVHATWILVLVTAGCAPSHEYYHPTAHAHGRIQGYRDARYHLRGRTGIVTSVRIWSPGARRVTTPQGKRTVIQIGFVLENQGNAPVQLGRRALMLQSVQTPSRTYRDLWPSSITGSLIAPPRGSAQANAYFTMPPGVSPEQVKAFRVSWTAVDGGQVYTRMTPFAQNVPRYADAYVPAWGYYYPYAPDDFPYYMPLGYGFDDDVDFDEAPTYGRPEEIEPEEGGFGEGFGGDFDEGEGGDVDGDGDAH